MLRMMDAATDSSVTFECLAILFSAAAPLDEALQHRASSRWNTTVAQMYGITETLGVMAQTRSTEVVARSVGRPFPLILVKLASESSQMNEVSSYNGELHFMSPQVNASNAFLNTHESSIRSLCR